MNIVVLASRGSEQDNSNFPPNLLLELNNKLLLEHFLDRFNFSGKFKIIFVVDKVDVEKYKIDKVINMSSNMDMNVAVVNKVTKGALCSFMLSVDYLNIDDELLILNSNELINTDFQKAIDKFRNLNSDAGVITFDSIKPIYSYVQTDQDKNVLFVSEKNPISRNATAGFYWYKSTKNFLECAENSIMKNDSHNNTFFICPVFNQLILKGNKISALEIDNEKYIPIKSNFHKEKLILESGGNKWN